MTGPRLGARHDRQLDVLADQAPQHLLHVGHDGVQVEDARLQHLLAAEGQELAGQVGGALARPCWICSSVAALGVAGSSVAQQELARSR